MKYYRLFGVILASEIELPNLLTVPDTASADYVLKLGIIPLRPQAHSDQLFTYASPEELYHEIPGIAKFYCNKNIIIVENKLADAQTIKTFLLDTIFTYILNQIGCLILKGSALKIGNTALIITSKSSNGKTSLAASLHKEFGYPIISDGILIIKSNKKSGPAHIIYNNTPLTLWQDSCKQVKIDYCNKNQMRANILKYEFPIDSITSESIPISQLIHLTTHNVNTTLYETLTSTHKMDQVIELTAYPTLVEACGNTANSFKLAVQLASSCTCIKITRPSKYDYKQFAHEVNNQLITNSSTETGIPNE